MTPDQYCQERAAASGSSFYYSFLFLEPRRRQAITALYEGRASHPVTQALATSLKHFFLPQEQLLEIIEGMEMDLSLIHISEPTRPY